MIENYLLPLYLIGTFLLTALSIGIIIFVSVHKKKQAKSKQEKQQLEFEYQKELLNARLEEQEKAMALISEEIHDNVGQVLGLSRMYLHRLSKYVHEEEGKSLLEKSGDFLSKAANELRHISHSLNSELLQETGLSASLERETAFIEESSGVRCSFEMEGEEYILEREKNLLVFRIVQEAMQNIIKHSEATHLLVSLKYTPSELLIRIEDNGKGFSVEEANQNNSLGLRNIRNRARLLCADLNITSASGKGTILELHIPRNGKSSLYESAGKHQNSHSR